MPPDGKRRPKTSVAMTAWAVTIAFMFLKNPGGPSPEGLFPLKYGSLPLEYGSLPLLPSGRPNCAVAYDAERSLALAPHVPDRSLTKCE